MSADFTVVIHIKPGLLRFTTRCQNGRRTIIRRIYSTMDKSRRLQQPATAAKHGGIYYSAMLEMERSVVWISFERKVITVNKAHLIVGHMLAIQHERPVV